MSKHSRRSFLIGGLGLGVAAASGARWVLAADADPTEPSGEIGDYSDYLTKKDERRIARAERKFTPTEDNILGPFYRRSAPYRAKVTPPLEPGTTLLIRGRVWAHDTKRPLNRAVLDVWQANEKGRYDNDDPKTPPKKGVYINRARLVTDESGYYEFETIHPGRYKIAADTWRPAHIHYLVQAPGYKTLVTQLYFKGDPHNARDAFIKKSLIIDLKSVAVGKQSYELGWFDIVLAKK